MKTIVAIVGRENVGKSTLFNRLAGKNKAVIDDLPGLTRDRNYAEVRYQDRDFILIDTGGFEPHRTDSLSGQIRAQTRLAIEEADGIIVATDDERVAVAAAAAGAEGVMTGEGASGADRIAEAVLRHAGWGIVINLQGDEPRIAAENIDALVAGMRAAPEVGIATLCRPLDPQRVSDPNAVKVVGDAPGRALYFSRSPLPYPRDVGVAQGLYRLHLGIYGFRRGALASFVALPPSPLERAEALEQLRALENGMEILVLDAPQPAFGVDTPEDLAERRSPV